jgi:hypothetical protein
MLRVASGCFSLAGTNGTSEKTVRWELFCLARIGRSSIFCGVLPYEVDKRLVFCQLGLGRTILSSRAEFSCGCCCAFQLIAAIFRRCYSRRFGCLSLGWASANLISVH